ncbi:MAG: methanogenesis marker 16 metalloprotein [Promethearchaeota archaeon]
MKRKSYEEIREKIRQGRALVMTAQELCDAVRAGEDVGLDDVDVVTTGTKGLMSGSTAILHFRVAEPKAFKRAKRVYLNGIPCAVGPCPNETLGLIDTIVFATTHSVDRPKTYGGGHLFRDLVERKDVNVRVVTSQGNEFETTTNLDEMAFARFFSTRTMFRNYLAFVNDSSEPVESIFSSQPLLPNVAHATFCGCGEINPFQKDPRMKTIGVGTRLLVNGAVGMVVSRGTRSTPGRPNIMTIADMKQMVPNYLGGFHTPEGPEVIITMAVAIPVLDEALLADLKKTDDEIPLTVVDVNGRLPVAEVTYGDVWRDNFSVLLNPQACASCELRGNCPVVKNCPTRSFSFNDSGKPSWNKSLCVNCGSCVTFCPKGAFRCNLGSVKVRGRSVPVFCRQSDRACANELTERLKRMVLDGKFPVVPPLEPLWEGGG